MRSDKTEFVPISGEKLKEQAVSQFGSVSKMQAAYGFGNAIHNAIMRNCIAKPYYALLISIGFDIEPEKSYNKSSSDYTSDEWFEKLKDTIKEAVAEALSGDTEEQGRE